MLSIGGADLWVWLQGARQRAAENAVDLAEADWLLQAVTELDSLALRLASFKDKPSVSSQRSLAELEQLWQQRLQARVPVQYLVGCVPWRDLMLKVSPDVLIPRPETELIVEIARDIAARSPLSEQLYRGIWADLGTGSGAIALGLATVLPQAQIIATDVSADALAIAAENAARNGLGDRIQFLLGAWFEPLSALKGHLAGVVSNPPYIPSQTVLTLAPEVTHHEPHLALDGGESGLESISHLVKTAHRYLQPGGIWLIEIMSGQGAAVTEALRAENAYEAVQLHYDLAGIQRFASALNRPI
ncbi:MAG: peptide chain release factor N(5)-glutamine methyltransferase [Leptolyngbyaceae cyanobacterium SM1_1_3]|nr:peptide chain release factor N(5)-glutamine methyltransferase [Leptolyngbyaceae cyanobacterium SM1_1_3]NJN04817.1 peptide chain release factor N(5)-glutamine methyltransferase [Leptolyngbyaceae cyanobacterium RM1_1_2]NJO11140.1 peptide chain release factor N(5)-glutamine methyltransferase [Leptolyngbyaceae cyanobacterium SL_1_1]